MHGFGFQIDMKICAKSQSRIACWQNSTKAVFLSNQKVQFWIFVIWQFFSFRSPYCKMKKVSANVSVKSSWEVHWIIMLQKDAVCASFNLVSYKSWSFYLLSCSSSNGNKNVTKVLWTNFRPTNSGLIFIASKPNKK